MPRSFVILYTGREGSSAIIKAFADRQDIIVPVMEDFDPYACADLVEGDVPAILNHMLGTARFSKGADHQVTRPPAGTLPRPPAVGFKWRIWGDATRIAEVFREHGVVVFELLRHDIVNLALSLYLTNFVLPLEQLCRFPEIIHDPNPQFRTRWLERAAQEEVIKFIRSREFAVDLHKFIKLMEGYAAGRQHIRTKYVDVFRAAGLEVHTSFYEDFLTNPTMFLSRMAELLSIKIDPNREPYYRKVARDDIRTQVTNLSELETSREVLRIKLSYYDRLLKIPLGSSSSPVTMRDVFRDPAGPSTRYPSPSP